MYIDFFASFRVVYDKAEVVYRSGALIPPLKQRTPDLDKVGRINNVLRTFNFGDLGRGGVAISAAFIRGADLWPVPSPDKCGADRSA